MTKKIILLFAGVLLLSAPSQAQFKKLIKKAKKHAVESVLGKEESDDNPNQENKEKTTPEQASNSSSDQPNSQSEEGQHMPQPKPIDFPVTGDTIYALHGIFAPVLDGAAAKIKQTPQGKYFFELAREKGLKGSDADILRESMDTENREIIQEINEKIEEKFPKASRKARKEQRKRQRKRRNLKKIPGNSPTNPAWSGISVPSLAFWAYVGSFDIWFTPRYIKASMRHTHFTMADAFGINMVSITDLLDNKAYGVGSVLGTQFAMVKDLDTIEHNIYDAYGLVKSAYLGVPGIEIEAGKAGMYGKYHTVSEKIVIPVKPYTDPATGKKSDGLLYLHDILSDREDLGQHPPHYNPHYKLIYKFYFTHDLDKYLTKEQKTKLANGITGKEGICIGAKISDENGNSANYRLINVKVTPVDKGAFQVPDDYPIMTQQELNEEMKKKFSLKHLFKGAVKNIKSDSKEETK